MTRQQLNRKYSIKNNKDANWDDDYLSDLIDIELTCIGFNHCCGLDELPFECGLRKLEQNYQFDKFKLTEEFLYDCLSYKLAHSQVAGIIFSDIKNNFTKINKLLSVIVPPITCGTNPNSGRVIYLWVVTVNALKNYKANKKIEVVKPTPRKKVVKRKKK